jgi:hypothetical protein
MQKAVISMSGTTSMDALSDMTGEVDIGEFDPRTGAMTRPADPRQAIDI